MIEENIPGDGVKFESEVGKHSPSLRHLGKVFLPMFAIAAMLPAVLYLVLSPQSLSLSSRASKTAELRLWLEPTGLATKVNLPTTLQVMAEFEEEGRLLPDVTAAVESEQAIKIDPTIISYKKPFRGRTLVGTVTITAKAAGTYKITLPQDTIHSTLGGPITVVTSPATVTVTN